MDQRCQNLARHLYDTNGKNATRLGCRATQERVEPISRPTINTRGQATLPAPEITQLAVLQLQHARPADHHPDWHRDYFLPPRVAEADRISAEAVPPRRARLRRVEYGRGVAVTPN